MQRYKDNVVLNRSRNIRILLTLIFLAIIIRLFTIQILKGGQYKEQANKQQTLNIEATLSRGNIFDRNGFQITNREKQKTAFIFNKNIENDLDKQNKLKKSLNYSNDEMKVLLNSSKSMIEISLNDDMDIQTLSSIKDVIIIDKNKRYSEDKLLSHVIGYVNKKDNKGISGIEKSYDNEPLKSDLDFGKTPIFMDAKRNVVPGVNVDSTKNNNTNISNSLQLTIDYPLQKKVEDILDESGKKGAVIVSQTSTGDILSMVSRPNIDLNDMESSIKKGDHRLFNKSLELSYPPGSIFKIPVILAALEAKEISLRNELYCKGYDEVGSTIIKCNKIEGHGNITIEEGLYKSCNSTFIQLGKLLGAKKIMEMSQILGFGKKVEVGIEEESSGNLPSGKKLLGPAIGNISIGQGDIEVTPIQVSNMMMIVANEGIKKDMSLVKGYVTQEGDFAKAVKREDDKRVLSKAITSQVKSALDQVINKGTASNIKIEDIGGGGGKTGTAQAVLNEKKVTHAWFSGYYPRQNPEYVITVFIEEGDSGSGVAAPIFEKIIKEIYKLNN